MLKLGKCDPHHLTDSQIKELLFVCQQKIDLILNISWVKIITNNKKCFLYSHMQRKYNSQHPL